MRLYPERDGPIVGLIFLQSTAGHFWNHPVPYVLFSLSFSLHCTELNPFLTVYGSQRMDASVLHQLLFYICADWVQLAVGGGCPGISLHGHGQQSDKESYSIHFHTALIT